LVEYLDKPNSLLKTFFLIGVLPHNYLTKAHRDMMELAGLDLGRYRYFYPSQLLCEKMNTANRKSKNGKGLNYAKGIYYFSKKILMLAQDTSPDSKRLPGVDLLLKGDKTYR
jgi:hypothetical protein